jgi:hypothetical protein
MFRILRASAAAAFAVACFASSSPAGAHALAIDNAGHWNPLGLSCSPCAVTLGFSINAGGGLTNQLYVYNNGLISIGQPFSAVPVLTPSTVPVGSPQNFVSGFTDTSVEPGYFDYTQLPVATFYQPSDDYVIFPALQADGSFFDNAVSVEFQPDPAHLGAFTMTFNLGTSDSGMYTPFDWYDLPDALSGGSFTGYPLIGYEFGANSNYGYLDGDSVYFNFGAAGTPEP